MPAPAREQDQVVHRAPDVISGVPAGTALGVPAAEPSGGLGPAARVWVFNAALLVLAAIVIALVLRGPQRVSLDVPWPAIFVLALVLRQITVSLRFGGGVMVFTSSEIALVVAFFTVPPLQGVLVYTGAMALSGLLERHTGRRSGPWFKDAFNVASAAFDAALGFAIFEIVAAAGAPALLITPMSALAAVLGTLPEGLSTYTILLAISIHAGTLEPLRGRTGAFFSACNTVATGSLGLIAVAVGVAYPYLLIVMAVQSLAVILLVRRAFEGRDREAQLASLHSIAQELLNVPDFTAAAEGLLSSIRATFRVETVRFSVLPGDVQSGSGVRWSVGDGPAEVLAGWRPDPASLDLVQALTESGAAGRHPGGAAPALQQRARDDHVRTLMAALIGSATAPIALLELVGRDPAARVYSDTDLDMLQTLAAQLTTVIENTRLATEIADLAGRSAELAHRAFHDHLTGLANASLFHDRLNQALLRTVRGGRSVGVIYVDLDDFKGINDGHGHAAGNTVLAEVGRRLDSVLRREDSAARLGGDEFAVLLEEVRSPADVETAGRRILDALAPPVSHEGTMLTIAASLGGAFGGANVEPAALLAAADSAMYTAKRGGKNRFAMAAAREMRPA